MSASSFANPTLQDETFEKKFKEIATKISADNMESALLSADTLLLYSENNFQRIKSLMLIATLHDRKGNITKAIILARQADSIAKKEKNIEWSFRISGFLSSTFRTLGLLKEGEKHYNEAQRIFEKNKKSFPSFTHILLLQEKAYYRINHNKIAEAIVSLQQASEFYKQDTSINKIIPATTEQLLGDSYLKLNQFEKARTSYYQSLDLLGNQESELKGFIYLGIGKLAMHDQKLDSAAHYFNLTQNCVDKASNFNLKSSLYKQLLAYYKETGDLEKSTLYHEKYLALIKERTKYIEQVSNQVIGELQVQNKKKSSYSLLAISGSLVLVLLFVSYILYISISRKRERKKYLLFIRKIRDHALSEPLTTESTISTVINKTTIDKEFDNEVNNEPLADENILKSSPFMSLETENRILKELHKMEQGKFFLQNDISLASLSVRLKVNSKYLSHVINEHKRKDFNNYINELRINYIVDQLQSDSEYLDYKISYLAEKCGFSSHSKFTAVFKTVTGLTPSVFIANIRLDDK